MTSAAEQSQLPLPQSPAHEAKVDVEFSQGGLRPGP
jgi:hypothetical protein